MSHTTTPGAPQWQRELIAELRATFDCSTVCNDFLATIISRHAPSDTWNADYDSHVAELRATITRLEADNARLRLALTDIVESDGYNAALVAGSALNG